MNNKKIILVGKSFFWSFFMMGNICLFGYLISKNDDFAAGGYLLLILGTIINLLAISGLMIYGFIHRSKLKACKNASMIICLNIPIAIIYFFIGISLLKI